MQAATQRVPDKVLQWLYTSLKPQYANVDRTYSDVAKTLGEHPSLSPRTEVYTFENGAHALLLVLNGTLSVTFRGAVYRFPLALWIPHSYPNEPPMIYVTPTSAMVVRPGQHVSLEGKVYHPYLAQWRDHWNVSNILDMLSILRDAFAKEPPVIARQQQSSTQPTSPAGITSAAVRSPPAAPTPQSVPVQQQIPPPPPPKPSEVSGVSLREQGRREDSGHTNPPTLPPKPPQSNGQRHGLDTALASEYASGRQPGSSMGLHQQGHADAYAPAHSRYNMPPSDIDFDPRQRRNHLHGPSGLHLAMPSSQIHIASENFPGYMARQPPTELHGPPVSSSQPTMQPTVSSSQSFQSEPRKPIVDLLSAPVETILPGPSSNSSQTAPPIPPNPEKDAIVQALSSALGLQLSQTVAHNNAAIPALEAQHAAMQRAYQNMQGELSQLQQLDGILSSNEKILHEAMREADRVMEKVGQRNVPSVDDVLVAPTIVGEQLYGLVADVRGISDAMFALTRALDKGRIESDVFIKQTRTLARERFFKEALIKKIARGMALTLD